MYSLLILLLAQSVRGSFPLARPTQGQPFQRFPARYGLQGHAKAEGLARYRAPEADHKSDYVAEAVREQEASPVQESRLHPRRLVLARRFPGKQLLLGFPSPYMKPPSPESLSHYAKYHSRPMNLDDERQTDYLPPNHRPDVTAKDKKKGKIQHKESLYVRDHAPVQETEPQSEQILESKKSIKKSPSNKESPDSLKLSPDGDRVDFQIQGHEGPKTYIFGFDTGDGKNRQFRLEEKLRDGTVKGQYGYYDARGKLRAIKYLAHPLDGYKEKHHESNNLSYKEESDEFE